MNKDDWWDKTADEIRAMAENLTDESLMNLKYHGITNMFLITLERLRICKGNEDGQQDVSWGKYSNRVSAKTGRVL